MSAALNNVTTQDHYVDATTLQAPATVRVNLQVANAAIYWQHSQGNPGGAFDWSRDEEFLLPGLYSFDLNTAAVRVRSAAAGVPAQVTIATRTAEEVPGA